VESSIPISNAMPGRNATAAVIAATSTAHPYAPPYVRPSQSTTYRPTERPTDRSTDGPSDRRTKRLYNPSIQSKILDTSRGHQNFLR
jgi:hypothetical protein